MRRLIQSAAAISAAFLALLLFASAVRSGAPARQAPAQAAASVEQTGPGHIQSAPAYSRTRIVTVTVGTTAAPGSPGLNSRWQIDTLDDKFFTGTITLQSDASAITVTLVNGEYSINFAAPPTIWFTNSQGLYYEYSTNQQARRFGNQILISQTYKYFPSLHYVGTVIFTDPYRYVGYSGYAPAEVDTTRLHWDESFTETKFHEFDAAAWLVDPGALRPDLEILDARVMYRRLNHIYVTATIQNAGGITAGAPAFVNLYDRLTDSPPAGPLDLAGGWCTLDPVTRCGISASNRLPTIPPFQTTDYTAEYDLSAINGQHYLYLFVDALGSSSGVGLNYESAEQNNSIRVGSLFYKSFTFLPLVQHK